jgi:hypothetical protein
MADRSSAKLYGEYRIPRALNPTLYGLLLERFGRVEISAKGESAVFGRPTWSESRHRHESTIVHEGEYYRVNCFAPETMVATPTGDVPIKDLVGTPTLLVPDEKGIGHWEPVEVRSFGRQRLLTVTLRRGRAKKTIRATAAHRWVLSGPIGLDSDATTAQLEAGDRLASCFVSTLPTAASEQALHWVVESVEDQGEEDEVFCAVVPGNEKFTLADNILTRNCPFCGDTRKRLYVNHLWNTIDKVSDEPMKHLATCFNEGCLAEKYASFEDLVIGFKNQGVRDALRAANFATHRIVDGSEGVACATLPGDVQRLMALSRKHPAVRYLTDRGYDVEELTTVWDVGVVVDALPAFKAMQGRVFIPVFLRGERVGWQGRWPADDWKQHGVQKYYNLTGFRKSKVLYNHDAASLSRHVVVVEGVSDVWAVGPSGVALLGKSVSPAQEELLGAWAKRGALLVLMLDPGAWTTEPKNREAAAAKRDDLLSRLGRTFDKRVVEVELPAGRDPGSLTREVLRKLVREQVKEAGFAPMRYDL